MSIIDDLLSRRALFASEAEEMELGINERQHGLDRVRDIIFGLNIAIELLQRDQPAAEPAPAKPPRLDIAQAVLGFLTKNGGTVVRDIATALDRKPSQIEAAIGRLGDKVAQHDDGSYGLVSEPAGERVA